MSDVQYLPGFPKFKFLSLRPLPTSFDHSSFNFFFFQMENKIRGGISFYRVLQAKLN